MVSNSGASFGLDCRCWFTGGDQFSYGNPRGYMSRHDLMKYQVDADSLRADIAALATNEGRMVGSVGHERARDFLCKRMSILALEHYNGAADYVLSYRSGDREFYNLVGVIPGADRLARPVLLGAHYDSVIDAPCADDNAAAVAITLAVAEHLRREQPARDVLVTFFDAEEPPYFLSQAMGSVRFVLEG